MNKTVHGTKIKIIGPGPSPDSVTVEVVKDGRVTDILKADIALSVDKIDEILGIVPEPDELPAFAFVGA